jgi:hypothetical protein
MNFGLLCVLIAFWRAIGLVILLLKARRQTWDFFVTISNNELQLLSFYFLLEKTKDGASYSYKSFFF